MEDVWERLAAYRDDPNGFNADVLDRKLWSKQVEICDAVARSRITLVPAGRACGKSFVVAGMALWWLYTRPMSLVITTGPDHRQVVSVLWKEIKRALRTSRVSLPYEHLTNGYGSPQRLAIREEAGWAALGFAALHEEGFSGQHAGELLVIVDEASGITEPIWNAIHGLAANRLVVVGNPLRYDCHFRELYDLAVGGSPDMTAISISSLECPDAEAETSAVGMACAGFLRQMAEIHGRGSPWWNSNIEGRFPGQESVRFIPTAWLDACANPAILDDELWQDYPAGSSVMGVDVGGGVGADKSVIVVRNRKQLLEIFASEWHGVLDDARHRLEPEVIALARKWDVAPERCLYDKAGIGRNFGSYLASRGFEGAIGVFGAGKGGKFFVNRRTANAYALRKRLDPGIHGHVPFYVGGIPQWPLLRQELMELRTPETEMDEGVFKQKLEDRETLKDRLKRSPDTMDAFAMSFSYVD